MRSSTKLESVPIASVKFCSLARSATIETTFTDDGNSFAVASIPCTYDVKAVHHWQFYDSDKNAG